ncbi:glycosyltransferase family A protein [Aquitalea sp.]|uniref:glycosyltransferase family 2 protein n=1 Tax=Aquitalea sp. TaxID=1872623 RepID=UPI00258EC531|nr:glycosyltransferase family A protein [Aquitalea sp.]
MKNTDSLQSNNAQKLLTIAIPTYKRKPLLAETLSSLEKCNLNNNVEVIIVDNDHEGNNDIVEMIKENFSTLNPAYYRNSHNIGMVGNWNQCMKLAEGKFITILHDDDLVKENFIDEVMLQIEMNRSKEYLFAFRTSVLDQRIEQSNIKQTPDNSEFISKISVLDLFFTNFFHGTLGIIFDREKALAIGGFEENWYPISDYEFWCRWACKIGTLTLINKDIALYRIAENESMKEVTRQLFTSQSLELRRKLVLEKNVPAAFAKLVNLTTCVQKIQVENYWSDKSYIKKIPGKILVKTYLILFQIIIKMTKAILHKDLNHERK